MTKKINFKTIAYWVATALLSFGVGSAAIFRYILGAETMKEEFDILGYPGYLVLPLGIAKLAALFVILFVKNRCLKHWAYAGLFYNFVLAFVSHIGVGDSEYFPAVIMIVFLAISYFTQCKGKSKVS